jgi:hypothetical protein
MTLSKKMEIIPWDFYFFENTIFMDCVVKNNKILKKIIFLIFIKKISS